MDALWIAAALVVAGFAGWPVTALVFRLARTIDDKADAEKAAEEARRAAEDPAADVTVGPASHGALDAGSQSVDGELTAVPQLVGKRRPASWSDWVSAWPSSPASPWPSPISSPSRAWGGSPS